MNHACFPSLSLFNNTKMKIKKFILNLFCLQPKKKIVLSNEKMILQEPPVLPISLSTTTSTSTSSSDNSSGPQTPTHHHNVSELRGIFRTLEPVWYYHASLLPPSNNNQQEWVRFDDSNQSVLETSFLKQDTHCTLYKTNFGACSIQLQSAGLKKPSMTPKNRYSMMTLPTQQKNNMSMPTLITSRSRAHPHTNELRPLELNKDVRRIISPVWWFEQDLMDGTKGMSRFDEKNQIRLEALSDGRRSRLVLSDDAFHGSSFIIVLEQQHEEESKEEVRGFLYFEPGTMSKKDRFLKEGFVAMEDEYHHSRRYSI